MSERLIKIALGEEPADLILRGAKVFNVFTGQMEAGSVAIGDGRIAGVGDYRDGAQILDLEGRYLVPGFINAHCHVESSMASPARYCAEELRWGVTTLITDPHEVANVAGLEGIRYMLEESEELPVNYYVQLPSCVPSTPFEHSGAALGAEDLKPLLSHPRVLGLGEMMDYPGVLGRSPHVMEKLRLAGGRVVDGHAPSLTGKKLAAYAAAGIATDHESAAYSEAREKLAMGMAVLVREGSACKNLEAIIGGVVAENLPTDSMAFCTDDKHLADIRREGTVRHCVRKAISLGLSPSAAYRMATLNAARIYGLRDLGAIAPGYRADLVVLDSLEEVTVAQVFKDGRPVHPDEVSRPERKGLAPSVRLGALTQESFVLPDFGAEPFPVVRIVKGQLLTEKVWIKQGEIPAALASGRLCKLAVAERHHATGHVGVGLLEGFGLKSGALAITIGHDSHNLMIVGGRDDEMLLAAREIQAMQGGVALVGEGKVLASLPLPLYGLMTDADPEALSGALERVIETLRALGVSTEGDPIVTLSFLALPVIPEIRVTDMGIFDVDAFRFLRPKQGPA